MGVQDGVQVDCCAWPKVLYQAIVCLQRKPSPLSNSSDSAWCQVPMNRYRLPPGRRTRCASRIAASSIPRKASRGWSSSYWLYTTPMLNGGSVTTRSTDPDAIEG